jgi:hypothetical protein
MPSSQPLNSNHGILPPRGIESYPLQPMTRKNTASTVSTTSTAFTTSSTSTSSSTTSRAKNALQHLAPPLARKKRASSWHSSSTEDTKRREIEERSKEGHKQNLYTDCGRHSNEWLFSGWGDLAKWALGRDGNNGATREEERRAESRAGSLEETRGRALRREE